MAPLPILSRFLFFRDSHVLFSIRRGLLSERPHLFPDRDPIRRLLSHRVSTRDPLGQASSYDFVLCLESGGIWANP